jgi:hypothetical protein
VSEQQQDVDIRAILERLRRASTVSDAALHAAIEHEHQLLNGIEDQEEASRWTRHWAWILGGAFALAIAILFMIGVSHHSNN